MKKFLLIFFFLLIFIVNNVEGRVFKFVDEVGRKYKFKVLNNQVIYKNGNFFGNYTSLNKAVLEVVLVTNGYGLYKGRYDYYEKTSEYDESFKLVRMYYSEFYRDSQGRMIISPNILMPVLRSVPVFPTNDITVGDSWVAEGEEVHEGILNKKDIIRTKIKVYYKYLGDIVSNDNTYSLISIDYHVIHYPDYDPNVFSFTGFSHSIYYWDNEYYSPRYYYEDYSFLFTLRNGETALFSGRSQGYMDYISEVQTFLKNKIYENISVSLSNNKGVSIKQTDEGIILTLENILFDVNKFEITDAMKSILNKVANQLNEYKQFDILVSGHTDNTGTPEYNLKLSEKRAKSVTDFLIKNGIDPDRISFIGYGSSKPISDNSTELGRALNRRVEIKIITKEKTSEN